MRRLLRRAVLVTTPLALALLVGCTSGAAMPDPTTTLTPDPTPVASPPNDYDPRCDAGYGVPTAVPERQHKVRPSGWPVTPPFASLCRLEPVSFYEEIGSYATDPGTKFDDVLWYYEHAFSGGVHGYANVPGADKVLTGVFNGVSYVLEQDGFDRYRIHWAWDGEYDSDLQ